MTAYELTAIKKIDTILEDFSMEIDHLEMAITAYRENEAKRIDASINAESGIQFLAKSLKDEGFTLSKVYISWKDGVPTAKVFIDFIGS